MSDLQSDSHDRSGRPLVEQARAARRETLTEHGRLTEDLIDRYTQAVKDDVLLEFFSKLAAEIATLRRVAVATGRLKGGRLHLDASAREAAAAIRGFIDKLNELDAAKGGK